MRNREHVRFVVSGLALIAALLTVADAQITVPFPAFTSGTTIQPDEVNQNFGKFADALNRTGGTMTGTLTTRDVLPDGNNTRDLGLTGTRYRDGWFGRNVAVGGTFGATGAATFSSTIAVSDTATLRTLLPQTTATYDVGVTGTRWRDGFFSRNVDVGGTFGATGAATFAESVTEGGALFETGVISPTTISADQNNYAPTGFSTARVLRLTHNNTGSFRTITGLAGGAAGRVVMVCNVNASASEDFLFSNESASSTAANRFALPNYTSSAIGPAACMRFWYDGVSSRWRMMTRT